MISQTAEYALRAVVYLGSQTGQPTTTQRIAAATQVPVGYLSKVMQSLGGPGWWRRSEACAAVMCWPGPWTS